MKRMKKLLSVLLILAVMLSMEMISFTTAYAASSDVIGNRYEDEPLIYGLQYYTGTVSCSHWTRVHEPHNFYDYYLMSVPANGTITITCYGMKNKGKPSPRFYILPESEDGSVTYYTSISSEKEKYPDTRTLALKAGNYYVRIGFSESTDVELSYTYFFSIDYQFDSSTSVKLTSPSKGAIKVSAPKGDKVDGFEVRYKKDGDEEWTYIDIEGNKNLNYTVSELKKGKKYYFQARKYITDEYGDKYYSNWTKKKSITAKSK